VSCGSTPSLQAGLSGLGQGGDAAASTRQALRHALGERAQDLADNGAIGRACQQFLTRLSDLHAAVDAFCAHAAQPDDLRRSSADLAPSEMAETADQLGAAHHGLHAWCAWRNAQAAARDAGLAALVGAIEAGDVAPARVPAAFETNYARWWVAAAVDEDDVLKRFVSAEHERRIDGVSGAGCGVHGGYPPVDPCQAVCRAADDGQPAAQQRMGRAAAGDHEEAPASAAAPAAGGDSVGRAAADTLSVDEPAVYRAVPVG